MNGDRTSVDQEPSQRSGPSSGTGNDGVSEDSRSASAQKDTWDKIAILARPLAAFLTAIVVAWLGILAQQALQGRQETMRDISANEQKEQSKRASLALKEQTRLARE